MDTSWAAITHGILGADGAGFRWKPRGGPRVFQLTTGEVLGALDAFDDPRNRHNVNRKRLYERLRSAEERGDVLTPELLWRPLEIQPRRTA
jgi:hypothetical protein